MVFSSLLFLCIFLPAVLLAYFSCKNNTYRNVVLVISSLIFYAWGEPVYVLALIFSSVVDYTVGLIINKNRGNIKAKLALIASVTINLGLLAAFKYSGFFVQTVNGIFGTSIPFKGFSLPLGISFYTFQTMSYSIDMYRGEIKVQRSLLKFMVYVSLFPQLVAGPIVRYIDIEDQINERRTTPGDFKYGVMRFAQGLFKKVILANSAGQVTEALLDGNLSGSSAFSMWLGILMYAFQIYYDFSGYSDMAIGLGRFFGFKFPENFNYPYISASITEFWRRWHISLGTFFRDYVYIPLGGNRRHQIINILVVWALTGFWHGASWNFILWGLYYAVWLITEKKLLKRVLEKAPVFVRRLYSSIIVLFGWALFYFTDFSRLISFFKTSFGGSGVWLDNIALSKLSENGFLIILLFLCATPLFKHLSEKAEVKAPVLHKTASAVWLVTVMAAAFVLIVGQTYNPFLYFRF